MSDCPECLRREDWNKQRQEIELEHRELFGFVNRTRNLATYAHDQIRRSGSISPGTLDVLVSVEDQVASHILVLQYEHTEEAYNEGMEFHGKPTRDKL